MNDLRETLFNNVLQLVTRFNLETDTLSAFKTSLLFELDKYEISDRHTDIVIFDDSSTKLINLYAGSLLTEGKSKITVSSYGRLLQRFYKDVNKSLTEVTVFDVRLWLAKMQQTVSLRTCETYRSYLSAFYQWCLTEEFIEKNPMTKIKPINYTDLIRKPFSDIELDALRSSCSTLRERAVLETLLSSGVRISELCNLNKDDVNFNTLELIVRKGKGSKSRITYINNLCAYHLKLYLDSRKDSFDCLFISRHNCRISPSSVERELHRLGKNSNVSNVHPHRCRRTFASSLAKNGMSVATIQSLMGHSDINTTMCYVKLSNDHIRNQYQQFI